MDLSSIGNREVKSSTEEYLKQVRFQEDREGDQSSPFQERLTTKDDSREKCAKLDT